MRQKTVQPAARRVCLAGATLLAAAAAGAAGSPATVPVQAAIQGFYQSLSVADFTATGPLPAKPKATADTYTLHFSTAPNPGLTVFREQTQAHSAVQTAQVTKNGAPLATLTTTAYFLADPFVPLGRVAANGVPYAAIINQYELPTAAAVGTSGPFFNMTWYHDTDMSAVDGFMTGSYSVTTGEGGLARVCLKVDTARVTPQGVTDGVVEGTQVHCFRIAGNGKATLETIEMSIGGQPLVFR